MPVRTKNDSRLHGGHAQVNAARPRVECRGHRCAMRRRSYTFSSSLRLFPLFILSCLVHNTATACRFTSGNNSRSVERQLLYKERIQRRIQQARVSRGAGNGSVVTLFDEEKCGRTVWIKAVESMTAKGVCQVLISKAVRSGLRCQRGSRHDSPIAKQAPQPAQRS